MGDVVLARLSLLTPVRPLAVPESLGEELEIQAIP